MGKWGDMSPLELELLYLHPRNPNELISKMAHIFEAGVIILGKVCRLVNSGMLIPWFYFGPISRGGGAVSSPFWTCTNLDEVFGKRSRILAFSQKNWLSYKVETPFFKKKEEERKRWLLFCSGLGVICWFHFISSWLGVVLQTYHPKNNLLNFYSAYHELLWSPWSQMARNSWRLYSLKLTLTLKMVASTSNLLFHGFIFRDYVSFTLSVFHGFPRQKLNTRIINCPPQGWTIFSVFKHVVVVLVLVLMVKIC